MGKDIFSGALVKRYLWHMACLISLLLMLAVLGALWYSGVRDAQNALQDGRRLAISLSDGVMTGWQYGMKRPGEKAAEPKPSDEGMPKEEAKAKADAQEPKQDEAAEEEQPSGSSPDDNKEKEASSLVPSVTAVHGLNKALTEESKYGLIPRIGEDGTQPWQYYSKPAKYTGDKPVIAIIVMGGGISQEMTEQIIKLPENITLSFSPYARNVESWATAARVTGHEVMLDLPLQPVDYPASDPGTYGLLIEAKPDANEQKLQWLLSRFGAFTGVITPLNEGYTSDTYSFAGLAQWLAKRGLILALSHDVVKDQAQKVIEESKEPILTADILLDEELTEKAIKTRIDTLAHIARDKGYAIGIAQSYPVTLEVLETLPERFEKEGLALMPLSYIARKKFK